METSINKQRVSSIWFISLALLFSCSDDTTVDPVDGICTTLICESAAFTKFQKTTNVVYGINSSAHLMTVFEPKGDSRELRPLVILLSGGSFGAVDISKLEPLAVELVKYGFIVATAGYRVGDASDGIPYVSRLIEAVQDSKAAVRFFRSEATVYKIDPEFIYIGGWSAGAISALNHAYLDEEEIIEEFKPLVESLGGIEGTQGNPNFSSSVKGVVSLAGALLEANTAIHKNDVQLFAIHGSNDNNAIYKDKSGKYDWWGSSPLVDLAQSLNVPADAAILENGDHSAPVANPDQYIDNLISFLIENQ